MDAAHGVAHPRPGLVGPRARPTRSATRASTNGTRYYYRLEDVDTSSKTTSHGPVSAVPAGAAAAGAATDEGSGRKRGGSANTCPDWVLAAYSSATGSASGSLRLTCTRHGDPEAVSLGVVSRDSRQATLELRTGGFYALHEPSGRVRVFVPGFDFPQDAQALALPIRRALVDAVVGRRVELGSVRALDLARFSSLEPALLGKAAMQVRGDGTVRASRRDGGAPSRGFAIAELARLLPSVFQGETKSAVVQVSPLRFDARSRQLTLARRVLVRLLFTGREAGESGRASRGRRAPRPDKPAAGELLARLYTTSRGLHAAAFEELFPGRARGVATSELRLERQGQPAAFHVEPASSSFGPGSQLFFFADVAAGSSDFSAETAWELLRSPDGLQMPLVTGTPKGDSVRSASTGRAAFEVNRFYQPGLLDASDLWLWDAAASGATRVIPFALAGVDASAPRSAMLDVYLQGGSESGQAVDHHVRVSLAGVPVGEAQFAGKTPYRMSLSLPPSLLHEGQNELSLTNLADTGVSSLVFLDRFTLAYPQLASVRGGLLEASWNETGTATVAGAASTSVLVDVTPAATATAPGTVRWLTRFEATGGSLRFRAEAGQRYGVVSREALLQGARGAAGGVHAALGHEPGRLPADRPAGLPGGGRAARAAPPGPGASARAVAFEEIADEFGHGEPSAEAIKSFLAYAYQSWARPSPRYVVLLGDASYDPRHFVGELAGLAVAGAVGEDELPVDRLRPAARRGQRRGRAAGPGDRPAARDDRRAGAAARRQAARVGGLGPGAVGAGRAGGRQSRPSRRLRGERRRHCSELPRRQERAAAAARAGRRDAAADPGRARLRSVVPELRRPRRRRGVGERERLELLGRGVAAGPVAPAAAADAQLPERLLRGAVVRVARRVAG